MGAKSVSAISLTLDDQADRKIVYSRSDYRDTDIGAVPVGWEAFFWVTSG